MSRHQNRTALVSGAVVERMRFGAFLVFATGWSVLIYPVLAHWAFGGGWLCTQGPLLRLPAASTGAGVLHTQIDWSGTAAVIGAGQSWSFQAWFRDPSTPKAFNVSEGLELGFQ